MARKNTSRKSDRAPLPVQEESASRELRDVLIRLSFPKIPSGLDSHRKAESSHH